MNVIAVTTRAATRYTATRLLALHSPAEFAAELERHASDRLNWICGLNPYASCMLNGVGLNNPQYTTWPAPGSSSRTPAASTTASPG